MSRSDLPRTVPLLAGLRWTGKLRIEARVAEGFVVSFDAEIARPPANDPGFPRFVYDRAVLTPKQLTEWTGLTLD